LREEKGVKKAGGEDGRFAAVLTPPSKLVS
jgi:hypothetical protein